MGKIQEIEKLLYATGNELGFYFTLLSFIGAVILAFLVKEFYVRYSYSLTGKNHIGAILPMLTAIVFLVIIVIKSSLALSLGLVGALSIVRFRTPIKEPEELVYLFLSIAIGLGFGAGYGLITAIITLLILLMAYLLFSNKKTKSSEYNLIINWKNKDISHENISQIISSFSSSLKLIRIESDDNSTNSVFLIELSNVKNFDLLTKELRKLDNNIEITFFESNVNF